MYFSPILVIQVLFPVHYESKMPIEKFPDKEAAGHLLLLLFVMFLSVLSNFMFCYGTESGKLAPMR